MRKLYIALYVCLTPILAVSNAQEQDRPQSRNDQPGGIKHPDRGALMRERGDRKFPGAKGGEMMGGEAGMQEMFLERILGNPKAASEVGLSEEQSKILKSSSEEMKKQHETLEQQLREGGLEQAKMLTGDSVDEAAIMAAVEKSGNIRTAMAKARIKHMLLVKKTLKPEQIAKIREMVQARMKQIRSERETQGMQGKSEGDSPLRDRMREHRKKPPQEENKEGKKTEEKKPGSERAAQGV